MAPQRGPFALPQRHEGLCPLAAKIPEVQRSGDIQDDTKATMRRDAYVRIVDTLWKEPNYVHEIANYLDSLKQSTTSTPKDGHFDKLTTLRCLDEAWCVGFLGGLTGWSTQRFEEFKVFEADAVKHLLCFALAASTTLRLPPACRDKELLKMLFETRAKVSSAKFGAFSKGIPGSWLFGIPLRHVSFEISCGAYRSGLHIFVVRQMLLEVKIELLGAILSVGCPPNS